MERNIEKGTLDGQVTYCPVNGWDCPYFGKDGICHVDNPFDDCTDWYDFWPDYEEWKEAE